MMQLKHLQETSKYIEPGRQQQPNWRIQRRGNINQELKYSRDIMSCTKTRCATVMLSSNQFLGLLLSITTACRQPMKILHCRRDDAGKRVKLLESLAGRSTQWHRHQDRLNGGPVKGHPQFLLQVVPLQHSQKVESLLGLFDQCRCVC
ncbi:hypothetical protein ATANTOWER_006374 [Ataeniobius toweri]|uniref:Uncharacterized protein n=1 Tax=Ataeniobius toweri TaxID=208326 RepID=A0ABU7BX17_9TELE|nr:hypothetical protein [Ataeniobius toweri]